MVKGMLNAVNKTLSHDDAGKLLLRLAVGGLMLFHGLHKLLDGVGGISGMLVATVVGIVFIPALFVLFQRLREWGHGLTDSSPTAHSASAPEKSASRHRR